MIGGIGLRCAKQIQERVSERTRRRDKKALPCAGWRWRERIPGPARLPAPPASPDPALPAGPELSRTKPMLRSWTYLIRRREHERSGQGHPDEAVGNRRVSLPVPRVAPPPARRRPYCARSQAAHDQRPEPEKSCPTASVQSVSARSGGGGGAHPASGTRSAAQSPSAGWLEGPLPSPAHPFPRLLRSQRSPLPAPEPAL